MLNIFIIIYVVLLKLQSSLIHGAANAGKLIQTNSVEHLSSRPTASLVFFLKERPFAQPNNNAATISTSPLLPSIHWDCRRRYSYLNCIYLGRSGTYLSATRGSSQHHSDRTKSPAPELSASVDKYTAELRCGSRSLSGA